HAAEKISHLLGDVGRPEALSIKQAAATVSGKYTPQNILPQWEEFFSRRIEAEKMSKLNIKGN
ncbi:MAG: hypothetical protein HOP36_12135, partial [Methyloglobulus sp.]|nr:hypothetical protein [Methyloglobulus sp.]